MLEQFHAVIMAGGSGTRLWPFSRRDRPKQLLAMGGQRTMLQETVARVLPLTGWQRVLVSAGERHRQGVHQELPQLPQGNVIAEPEGRNTAPAVGLAATYLLAREPQAVMAVLASDHAVADVEGFRRALVAGWQVAREGYLVCLGVVPTYAETGYGYIQRGSSLGQREGMEVFQVRRFKEKPDLELAERLVADGEHYWNASMFVWQAAAILEEIRRQLPELARALEEFAPAIGEPEEGPALRQAWEKVASVSVDVGVMEGARRVAVIPLEVGWLDVGSWASLYETLDADEQGNVMVGDHVSIDSRHCLIYAPDRLVATVGLEDLIIVDGGDCLLICPRERAQEVRRVVSLLRQMGREDLL